MRCRPTGALLVFFALCVSATPGHGNEATVADTPPMGWNSWDCYGDSVTEAEVLANASFMAEKLASRGWRYVVVDIRWTVQNPAQRPYNQADPVFTLDGHGRFVPAPNRFPSSRDGAGFKPLADKIHGMGLRFGIHIMRGLPKAAFDPRFGSPADGYPIEASPYRTSDVTRTDDGAVWLRDMVGVGQDEAGQAYYDSLLRLYADWGIDYLKVDDLNNPYAAPGERSYYAEEIEMIRTAIDRCGRPIVLSTSPGPTPLASAEHIRRHANLWRVSNDFWDDWTALQRQIRRLHQWTPYRAPGHWPDGDMLPLGKLALRGERGEPRDSRFTPDERRTLMTAWCIAQSPLMFGGDLPSTDKPTLELISNPEVLAVNQQGGDARQVERAGGRVVWSAEAPPGLRAGAKVAAVFNLNDSPAAPFDNSLDPELLDLAPPLKVRDLWTQQDLGVFTGRLPVSTPPHGSRLLLVTGRRSPSAELGRIASKPLYVDPVHDGAADPSVIWNPSRQRWWMFFTNRRANTSGLKGVAWVHGTKIGVAESSDGGATWTRVGDIEAAGPGIEQDSTFWAPEVVRGPEGFHLFLTVVPGVFEDWGHPRSLVHLISDDLVHWKSLGKLSLGSDRVIDACVHPLPEGGYRLWYNNERDRKSIYYADSPDLHTWEDRGKAVGDQSGEAPKVFRWGDAYWMLTDVWDGLAVYRSDDLSAWKRQPANLLQTPGNGDGDRVKGGHADVVVSGNRAFVFYFTHPGRRGPNAGADTPAQRRSVIQVAELRREGDRLLCDRDAITRVLLPPPEL